MNKMKIGYIKRVILLCLLCIQWLCGEGPTVEIKRQNELQRGLIIYVRDSTTQSTLLGAHVKIITEKDTIYMTTGGTSRGARYQQLLPDSVMVVAQYMGYQTVSAKVPTPAQVSISLPIKTMELNEVIVQGKEIAIINKGDTITYNISAFLIKYFSIIAFFFS